MKSNRTPVWIAGFLFFLSIILTFVFLMPKQTNNPKELNFDEAMAKIRSREVSEVTIKQDSLELVDKNKVKFFTKLDATEATREQILDAVARVNNEKPGSIKTNLEQASSGWGWIVLFNSLPFFIMWGLTLAVIVYAVSTLSRNKG